MAQHGKKYVEARDRIDRESVKVTSGPLSDFDGEIVDVNPDQQKLKVLVDIFERQVPVELSFDQVKKID